jgi:hypothetical protein
MNCKRTIHMIQQYFDGELTQLERAVFDEHVNACGECGREVKAYRGVFSLLGELDHADVPAHFDDAVIARVRAIRQARASRSKASRLWWVGVGSQPASRLIRFPLVAVVMLVAICFPFVMLRGGIREAAGGFVVLMSDAIVTVSAALEEFGVFYRLIEVIKRDFRIVETVIGALGSLAWWTGETVMVPGAVLIGGVIIFALFYRSAYKRRPHNASYSL